MDPKVCFDNMRNSELTRDENRQAACDLYNWLSRGGYPVNGWSREECKREAKKYMR